MSSSLPIKHPSLRPRVFDPFSRNGSSSSTAAALEELPGAIAMCGPAARRVAARGEMVHDSDDENYQNVVHSGEQQQRRARVGEGRRRRILRDDVFAPTDVTLGTDIMGDQLQEEEEDMPLKSDSSCEKHRWFFIFGGLIIFAIFAGVIAVVLVVIGGDDDTTTSNGSPSDSSSRLPSDKDWVLVSEIHGTVDSFGFDVDFNHDASLVAVAAPLAQNGIGQVEVYRRITTNPPLASSSSNPVEDWERVGDPIVGFSERDHASLGMDLSLDGSHLAVGYPGDEKGSVRVFRLEEDGEWIQQGQTLEGPSLSSKFGASVSISTEGAYLLVGAPLAGEAEQGMIQAYKWLPGSNVWKEHGNARYSDNAGDRLGTSVGMSSKGDVIVVGAPGDDLGWEDGGRVYYLKFRSSSSSPECVGRQQNGCWENVLGYERPVTGEAPGSRLGRKLSLYPEGGTFVTSSISYDDEDIINNKSHQDSGDAPIAEIGTGKVTAMSYDPNHALVYDLGFAIHGSNPGEGFGQDVAMNLGAQLMFVVASLNNETQTGIARAYMWSQYNADFVQHGSDFGTLPLGSGVWHHSDTGPYVGPSISMAYPRVAIGYQSVLLGENEEVPGVVRIFEYQAPSSSTTTTP